MLGKQALGLSGSPWSDGAVVRSPEIQLLSTADFVGPETSLSLVLRSTENAPLVEDAIQQKMINVVCFAGLGSERSLIILLSL